MLYVLESPVHLISIWVTGLLVFVFLLSGSTKLFSLQETVRSMKGLRVHRIFQNTSTALLISLFEMMLAFLLAFTADVTLTFGVLAAIVLLGMFSALMAGAIRRQESIECECFGFLSRGTPVSEWSVARNIILILLSGLVVYGGQKQANFVTRLVGLTSESFITMLFAWCLLALVIVSMKLYSQIRRGKTVEQTKGIGGVIVTETSAPSIGAEIPDVEVVSSTRQTLSLRNIVFGKPVLLIFLSGECGSCSHVAEKVPVWSQLLDPLAIATITSSRPDIVDKKLHGALPVMYYGSKAARQALGILSLPAAVVLGNSNHPVLASPIVYGSVEIENLVESVAISQASSR